MRHVIGTEAECVALRNLDAKANGYPMVGVHAGGGRHVAMTGDQSSPGWTRHHNDTRRHPTLELWAYPAEAIPRGRLSAAEQTAAAAAEAASVALGAGWEFPTP
jgi:hypothetical protein